MPQQIPDEIILEAIAKANGNQSDAAKALGIARTTLRDRLTSIERKTGQKPMEEKAQWQETRSRDVWIIESTDSRICTVDDAIAKAGVDMAVWEVDQVTVNGWDVTMKLKDGDKDKPFRAQNQQIRIRLKRKVPQCQADAAAELIKRMANHAPKYPKFAPLKKISDPHMLEISIFDHHFGKLAWAKETDNNYDLDIAENVFKAAVEELLQKAQAYPLEKILFPIGQDFFHIDNPKNVTINNTPQDVDGRFAKIFETGCMACVNAIDHMIRVAPVEIVCIPGNHDRTSSWFLVKYLGAWYRNCQRVAVNDSSRLRKYVRYGINLIGYTHGDEEKHDSLPAIMAAEAKDDWAATEHREWHVGHYHKRKEVRYNAMDTHVGIPVRILPSLSGTDYWHYMRGYVNNMRAAEAYLWSKKHGYSGHFSANAQG